jgi:5-methylcytosine-specific restriction endonuclease McrA
MNPSYKPPKKTRKISRKGLIKKLDNTCAQIIKIRDEHRCQMCGKYVTGSDAHCSHVLPKSMGYYVRWDLLNLKLLCYHCHMNVWHKNPTKVSDWFKDKFLWRWVYLASLEPNPLDKWNDAKLLGILAELQTKLNELKGEK